MLNEFMSLLTLFTEATTESQSKNTPSISFVAPSVSTIYHDLKNENSNMQYAATLCDALLPSLLSRFSGLLATLEVVVDVTTTFIQNDKFYELHKGPIFMLSKFLDEMLKLDWIFASTLPDASKERRCEKIKKLVVDYCVQCPLLIDLLDAQKQAPAARLKSPNTSVK